MALYVSGKVSTTYVVIGLGYVGRACEGCQWQEGISLEQLNLLDVASSIKCSYFCSMRPNRLLPWDILFHYP